MKNIIKSTFFLILICYVVTSCGSSARKTLISKETVIPQPNKTIIVFNNYTRQLWARMDDNYGKKNESIYEFKGKRSTGFSGYNIYILDPGRYTLEELYYNLATVSIAEIKHLGKKELLTFVAKPGEIIYIGDIKYDIYADGLFGWRFEAKINDNFADAKAYLSKEHPEINPNLLKKELVTIKPNILKK